ncbi:MAG TPA: hypothetical protein DCF91_06645 [Porphyromonadaceae bacterium]|nr:hypothetical protein [Porphyromonadaceae bacterium]
MILENRLGITDPSELARQEEKISKQKALELYDKGLLTSLETGKFRKELSKVVDWSRVDNEDYLMVIERSPIKDIEIKHLLKQALTDHINDRELYVKGIDNSYYYEGYTQYKISEL